MSEALDLPLRAQAAAIAAGEVDPAELLEATLRRIEERNPALNAIVDTFPEHSREMLASAPQGPLHGVPIVIKDEWPLPWRAQRFGAADMLASPEPGESGPYRALRAAAADCRLLDSVLFGEELRAAQPPALRIGVIRDEPSDDVAPAVREACETAIEDLRGATGGEVREIELPELAAATLATVLIANSESLGSITPERLNNLDPELSPLGRGLLKYRVLLPAVATIKAQQLRTLARHTLAEVFEQVDVIAWPTVPAVAPPLEAPMVELPSGTLTADEANVRGGALANLTGIPAISVPVGSSEGLPIGLQLQAAWGRDELLLDAAEALEGANGRRWVEAAPPPARGAQTLGA